METEQTFWQKNKWILPLVVIVVIASFLLDRCHSMAPDQSFIIPEQNGEAVFHDIKNTPIKDTILLTSTKWYKDKKEVNFLQREIDKLISENNSLKNEYGNANDSLQKLLYAQAIELNSFHETIDNDTIKIEAAGITQGKLKTLKIDWKIKSKTIVVKQKQRVFALKTGIEYGNSLELNKGIFKGNLEFENRKGNSYNMGFDTDQRIWLGYKLTLFEIKR